MPTPRDLEHILRTTPKRGYRKPPENRRELSRSMSDFLPTAVKPRISNSMQKMNMKSHRFDNPRFNPNATQTSLMTKDLLSKIQASPRPETGTTPSMTTTRIKKSSTFSRNTTQMMPPSMSSENLGTHWTKMRASQENPFLEGLMRTQK